MPSHTSAPRGSLGLQFARQCSPAPQLHAAPLPSLHTALQAQQTQPNAAAVRLLGCSKYPLTCTATTWCRNRSTACGMDGRVAQHLRYTPLGSRRGFHAPKLTTTPTSLSQPPPMLRLAAWVHPLGVSSQQVAAKCLQRQTARAVVATRRCARPQQGLGLPLCMTTLHCSCMAACCDTV